jgi:cysteine desulfurase family protein (TIGR01976 family)
MPLDLADVRSRFPALSDGWAYFDNAGGSLVLQDVADRVRDYLTTTSVQTGASYEPSRRASARLAEARGRIATLVNARAAEEIVFTPSTTVGMRFLATAMASQLSPGDEIVLTSFDHESNIGPWLTLEQRGVIFRWWNLRPGATEPDLDDLRALLTPRTRLVCVTHCSNILGSVTPVRRIADVVHAAGARLCVDGVAYAPHRAIDVQALDADYYLFSFYKCYGPHLGMLYGRRELLLELDGLYHWFYGREKIPGKLEPGNPCYELCWGAAAVVDYLEALGGAPGRAGVDAAFDAIAAHETALCARMLDWARGRNDVKIVGPDRAGPDRVPTLSFSAPGCDLAAVVARVDGARIGIRHGDFHSRRLVEALGLAPGGVIRASMVHYNGLDEVDRLCAALEEALRAERRAS